VALDQVTRTAIADLATTPSGEPLDIALDALERVPVRGNSALLDILVRNLVSNALRHGEPPVLVQVVNQGEGASLRVLDAGPGVPAPERERLGERFFRGSAATERGSGLGLSIVRRIVELHHGTVEFAAGPDGRGLEVRVTFPARGE
jgi:signal transduction histidine kinase